MLAAFLEFILSVFRMLISVFQYTDLGGFTFENVLVAVLIITLIVRAVTVKVKE